MLYVYFIEYIDVGSKSFIRIKEYLFLNEIDPDHWIVGRQSKLPYVRQINK